ncbi:sodium/glutamate symporter [Psittacicella hinzii]|uniref:Sodium/glutamate symporter n=1 Tax=Psittacicella hinzii TaxID=2028575 RepID=A0A3A1Y298_9GAMM|nr:sodium/glutamate symporter [Psittacicella hinzii]RIY31561.1 sodium/glutamate symporter [Psittacicella hinzii]
MNIQTLTIDGFTTLFCACVVLLVGRFVNRVAPVLEKFHIPTPVTGGLIVATALCVVYYTTGYRFTFDSSLSNTLMLLFFASIGFSADFKKLAAGGRGLVLLLLACTGMVLLQNFVGTSLAKLLGIDGLYGLLAGSVSLVGGHGTSGAWGQTFETTYGLSNATAAAFACATWGLIAGGLVGGPVAQYLIKRNNLKDLSIQNQDDNDNDHEAFEDEQKLRPIRASSVTEGIICLSFAMFLGSWLHTLISSLNLSYWPNIPKFVYVLFMGIVLRSILKGIFKRELKEVTIDVLGNVSLSLFIAITLISIKIWELSALALPILIILVVQTALVALYSIYVTFNVMGKNYDAAVMCAGQCGFSLGATPTAIANMQSVTNHFGHSHKAFLLIPLVGAFFIDFVNAISISLFATAIK